MQYNLSLLEYLILEHLYVDDYNYLVRDICNNLCVYKDYPELYYSTWFSNSDWYDLEAFDNVFNFVDRKKPVAIKDILNNCNRDEIDQILKQLNTKGY